MEAVSQYKEKTRNFLYFLKNKNKTKKPLAFLFVFKQESIWEISASVTWCWDYFRSIISFAIRFVQQIKNMLRLSYEKGLLLVLQ